jgi:hypothetical protein
VPFELNRIEGMVYTTLPLRFHLESLPEIVIQALALAVLRAVCGSPRRS